MMRSIAAGVLALALAGPVHAQSQTDPHKELRAKFEAKLGEINKGFEGAFGAVFIDLTDGSKVEVNPDMVLATASTIKVAILVELFRREDAKPGFLKRRHSYDVSDGLGRGGMANLIGKDSMLSLEDIAKLMINLSENNATNILIDEVGMENVNKLTAGMGLKTMRLQRKMLDRDAQAMGRENISSAADGAALMLRIAKCDLPVSQDSCARLRAIMEIPQPPHPGKDPIPAHIPIAFKWGGLEGVSNAWGIVGVPDRPYIFVIMTSFGTANENTVRAASAAAFDYYARLARANAYGSRVAAEVMKKTREKQAP
ncbi:MAG: class A beta-lactamase-related serine hydrolase [Proteobacteria bacterium]|nr:class A beta-lactamase-related serine hydrolase [Pseudomonadota bacterium]